MISAELVRKIKSIHIVSRRAVDSVMSGQYRSAFRGMGMEFEEFRDYCPGDDVKSIDWKVTARMRRPYVRLFREERELTIMLMVDMSASGSFGTRASLKKDKAVELAAALALSAIRNNDKVGAMLFTDRVELYIPPKKGASHVWRVIKELVSFTPSHKGTDIAAALDYHSRVMRKKSVTFVVSDFLDSGFENALKRLAVKHDAIAVLMSDQGERQLPEAGILEGVDAETGKRLLIDCSDKKSRAWYAARAKERRDAAVAAFKRSGVDYFDLATDGATADSLHMFFRARERRKR